MSYNAENPDGQATMAQSTPVVIASDQTPIPIVSEAGELALESGNLAAIAEGQNNGTQVTKIRANGMDVDSAHPLPISGTFADASGVPYSTSNRLPVDANITASTVNASFPPAVISSANSSATPLAAGATFTGTWEDVSQFAAISAVINTDVASASNGAVVEFSPDGMNVVRAVAETIPGGTGLSFMLAPEAKYVRFIYTNGATPQTSLWAQIIYHYQTPTPPQLPLGAVTTDANLAEINLTHLKLRTSTGQWVPAAASNTGKLQIDQVQPTTPADVQPVKDDYQTGEILADQTGADAVQTFTFSSPVHMVWVRDIGATTTNVSRVNPFGGTPSASVGIPVPNGEPTPITVQTSSIKVYAPSGSTISVWGYRRS